MMMCGFIQIQMYSDIDIDAQRYSLKQHIVPSYTIVTASIDLSIQLSIDLCNLSALFFNLFIHLSICLIGNLLDVLSGHEGPIACLDFSSQSSTLASGSWDGTLKLWDVYKNECTDTYEHGCDVLAVAFRPDGHEVCCSGDGMWMDRWMNRWVDR